MIMTALPLARRLERLGGRKNQWRTGAGKLPVKALAVLPERRENRHRNRLTGELLIGRQNCHLLLAHTDGNHTFFQLAVGVRLLGAYENRSLGKALVIPHPLLFVDTFTEDRKSVV